MHTVLDESKQRCILIGIDCRDYNCEESLSELSELCVSAGGEVIKCFSQKRETVDGATCIGIGKLQEIASYCIVNNIELAIFDLELTPVQIRNIEDILPCGVVDRTMLILDIFASRAKTADGKLQVELAQLKYRLPRLLGRGNSLSRLGGGIGTRGPGESKLESDKRHINRRIESLENELRNLKKRREITRETRKKNDVKRIALVGYTNVGKSTLLNKITGSDVFAKDMLFATLDPTTRAIELKNGQTVLLSDTVGFVSRLPHQLVSAFRSTLDEAVEADLILNVCDISSDNYESQLKITKDLLIDLGCDENKIITVFNKCDKLPGEIGITNFENSVVVSAYSGYGIDALLSKIENEVCSTLRVKLKLPYNRLDLIGKIKNNGKIKSQIFNDDGVSIVADIDKKSLHLVSNFIESNN